MTTILDELSLRYLGIPYDGTNETAVELIEQQRLGISVLKAHNEWLARLKAECEDSGREWTRENFLRMVQP